MKQTEEPFSHDAKNSWQCLLKWNMETLGQHCETTINSYNLQNRELEIRHACIHIILELIYVLILHMLQHSFFRLNYMTVPNKCEAVPVM